jgi:hypothetical protein
METGGEAMEAGTELARAVSFDPAPDEILRSESAPVVTNMVLVEETTDNDGSPDTCNIVTLPEMEYGKKEFSKSKTDKRRNSRENERRILLERRASQEKGSSGNKCYLLFASPAQLRKDLEKQILHEQSFQDQPLDTEIPHFSTFTDHHCAAGTQRLFIKGTSKDSNIPQRIMPVNTAFDMDGIQLFDYCQRNELLTNPEISEIFGLKIPPKRTLGGTPDFS